MVEVVVESSNAEDTVVEDGEDTSRGIPEGSPTNVEVSIASPSGETSETPDGPDVVSRKGISVPTKAEDSKQVSGKEMEVEPDGSLPTPTQGELQELELLSSSSSPEEDKDVPILGVESNSTLSPPQVEEDVSSEAASTAARGEGDESSTIPEDVKESQPESQAAALGGKEPLGQRRSSSTYKDGRPEPLFQRRT